MRLWELFLIAIGLSMDAFAVAACTGLSMPKATIKKSLIVGLYFGVFQALMPLIGWLLATWFADKIIAFDHWIAFGLLCFIGGGMIMSSFKKEERTDKKYSVEKHTDEVHSRSERPNTAEVSVGPMKMLPLAIATSIDALAVGVSLAFLRINIVPAVSFIGIVTFVLSMFGVKIGSLFGTKLKSKAEFVGGAILILIGLKILLEHII